VLSAAVSDSTGASSRSSAIFGQGGRGPLQVAQQLVAFSSKTG
jgi:hypothetical protein